MKNSFQTKYPFDKKLFANILKKAIGLRTQRAFAEDCGINYSYVSKLLNEKLDSPPVPRTLLKISLASENNITYHDLLGAAGYEPKNFPEDHSKQELIDFKQLRDNIELKSSIERAHFYSQLALYKLNAYAESQCDKFLSAKIRSYKGFRVMDANINNIALATWYSNDSSSQINLWQFFVATKPTFLDRLGYIATINYQNFLDSKNQALKFDKPKISFMATNLEQFNHLKSKVVPGILYPISIILLDLDENSVVKETYIKTGYTGNVDDLPRLSKKAAK